ncbi:acetyl-CoA carboxylase biotin carboxyl carrier protein subunit [bacterium]|nr:acetyl-CoA carboxylase biotin carboxyl carrier protein subunit [bacterium]
MALVNVETETAGAVWKINVAVGDRVEEDQEIMILESMKMEIPILSTDGGIVREIKVKPDDVVTEGDILLVLET